MLSDSELRSKLLELRSREREVLAEILKHLREVDRRKLFSDFGFATLFDYAVKELGYSEDEAYRRINAMRMIRELPQIEEDVKQGVLSLTSLSVAGSLFRAQAKSEPFSKETKIEILKDMRQKSRKESEAIAQKYSSTPKSAKMFIEVSPTLEEKMARVKGILAHSHPGITTGELFEKFCDEFLEQHEKKMQPKSVLARKAASKSVQTRNTKVVLAGSSATNSRYIPAELKRAVWQRDGGRCTICGARHALQYDHTHPLALGGETTFENLRLLCRNCNQRAAILKLGEYTMRPYLR